MTTISVILFWALPALLRCCTAQDLTCTVSPEPDGRTTYRIPDFDQSGCDFSWADAQNVVLATQEEGKDQNVLSKNETTLITRTRIKTVVYTRDCISEGFPRKAYCNATWAGLAEPVTAESVTHEPVTGNGSRTREILIYVAVGILALVFLLTILVAVVNRKIRERIGGFLSRLCPCLPLCPRTTMSYTPTAGHPEDVDL